MVTSQPVAIKVERADSKKQVLKLEVAVLKKIQRMYLETPFSAHLTTQSPRIIGKYFSSFCRRALT